MSLSFRQVLIVLALAMPTYVLAFRPANVSAGELALLPPYCPHTEGFSFGPKGSPSQSPMASHWEARLGPAFWTLHHYCWGLVNLNRLKLGRANTNNKQFFANTIVNEYYFVIRNSRPDFILLPEIWTRVGEAALLAGDAGTAMDAYANARRLKPDYWPAYAQWADFLRSSGRPAEARLLVEAGLSHAPDAVPLRDLYRSLGGHPAALAASAPASTPASPASPASGADSSPR
jgi:hypothetical protein